MHSKNLLEPFLFLIWYKLFVHVVLIWCSDIDGFIAVVGHTHVLHEKSVIGTVVDVIAVVNKAVGVY